MSAPLDDIDDDDVFTFDQAVGLYMRTMNCSREEAITEVAAAIESGELPAFEPVLQ